MEFQSISTANRHQFVRVFQDNDDPSQDNCWALFKHMSDSKVEAELERVMTERDEAQLLPAADTQREQVPVACEAIFDVLEPHIPKGDWKSHGHWEYQFFQLQRLLIEGHLRPEARAQQVQEFLSNVVSRLASGNTSIPGTFLLFCVHLTLYLLPDMATSDEGDKLVSVLLQHMAEAESERGARESVFDYVKLLRPERQVDELVRFLLAVPRCVSS